MPSLQNTVNADVWAPIGWSLLLRAKQSHCQRASAQDADPAAVSLS